jgi:hypothetical protein
MSERYPINTEELKQRLLEEGCSPFNFSIGPGGSDIYCLEQQNGIWRVFYTERGKADAPIFESLSEMEACEFYFKYITKEIRHDHLVGFFILEQNAIGLVLQLVQNGIPSHRDKIPYGGWSDPRYRVFVVGKDIFRAREVLGEVPLSDS